jgi:uncharacterized Fe-S cluster-containing protein
LALIIKETKMSTQPKIELPNLDCGLCGYPTCAEFGDVAAADVEMLKRCIHLSEHCESAKQKPALMETPSGTGSAACSPADCSSAASCASGASCLTSTFITSTPWQDRLGREFDFYLEHFPEDPGPREVILPRNPMATRELDIQVGDLLIGRPLGMSCGCPITHCGIAMEVDKVTGVISWCVTGPLGPRQQNHKNLGYYSAEAYEGVLKESRVELQIGARYFFQPRMCMLQWRHSGLVNFINNTPRGQRIRLEGLFIG